MTNNPEIQDSLTVTLDDRPVPKRIGLIVLATDHTTERDFARICDPDEVGVYATRIAYDNPTTPDSLRKTGPRLVTAADLILPGEPVDVIAYGCTSASVVLGDDVVFEALRDAKPGAFCVTPTSAADAALTRLGAKKIGLLTPYCDDVTDEVLRYFERKGYDVVSSHGLGLDDDREMARLNYDTVLNGAKAAISPDAEALFISCTAVRSMQFAQSIEDDLGKLVVTSNQAMVWHCLRNAGVDRKIVGYGRLFEY